MPRHVPPIALLAALPLVLACSAGIDEGLTSLSGAYTGPADGGDTGGGSDGSEGSEESAEGPGGTSSADGTSGVADGGEGNPLCCAVGPQAGCDSQVTETCVCTSQPTCCQNVWAQECVDLAVACGDPFCSGGGSSGDEGTSDDGGTGLACDVDFEFSPADPAPGVPFTATFTDPVGLTWVGMWAEAPGGITVQGTNEEITEDAPGGPFHWAYQFDGLAAGVWTFTFTHRQAEDGADLIAGTCQKQF